MEHTFDYLIIGAGMAGEAAAQALRECDAKASIGMLGEEAWPPYDRPPLTKKMWKDGKEDDLWRPIDKAHVDLTLKRRATELDRIAKKVRDDHGDTWKYGKLLIATGGTPRQILEADDFIYYRKFDDYQRLRETVKPGARIGVVGSGFIGSEIAAAMAMNDCKVTMLFPEELIGERVYPVALAESVTAYYREKGVELRPGARVSAGQRTDTGVGVNLADGTALEFDAVVAGLGITPNVELAKIAGLEVNNGIVVNEHLRTSDANIYAAGDVASFPADALGRHLRVEHENAAITMGTRAGKCMAGVDAPYDELPYFYSDLFDLGYEAVGILRSDLETVEQWVTPYRDGIVYYLDAGRVRGVLLWNTWGQVEAARNLIAAPGPFDADNVRNRLPAQA